MSVDGAISLLNPVIAALLRSPLHPLLSPGLVLLTITGRHTGRRYSIPVGYQHDGDDLVVMVSEARRKQWWRNYYEPAPVAVRLRGREHNGHAELVAPGSDEFCTLVERTLQRLPWMGRVFHVDYDTDTGLRADQFDALGEEIAIVRIRLENPGGPATTR